MKIVLNKDYGGFSISDTACEFLGLPLTHKHYSSSLVSNCNYYFDDDRSNPQLIECVEKLGSLASGAFAALEIVEIPDETTDYYINDYDGLETVFYVIDGKILLK